MAIGSWNNEEGNRFSSPGIHGFENVLDTKNNYFAILFLRVDTEEEEPPVFSFFYDL